MILCLDCGNTLIKCGIYDKDELKQFFTLDSKLSKSSSEYEIIFKNIIKDGFKIDGAILSSVVPLLSTPLTKAIKSLFNVDTMLITKAIKTGINIKIDYPNELGNDMLCGAVGAKAKYPIPCVVADLGTATKMYVVDKDGSFIGGIITCGMEVSMKALDNSTSLLTEVNLKAPKKIIGKNTIDCIKSGIIFGQAYMISEFARRMEKELGYSLNRIITGGFASEIKDQVVCFSYDEHLVLDGLNYIFKINNK